MTYKVSGVIESSRKDGKGIKVNGEWYSAFRASQIGDARYKDEVSFDADDNEKGGTVYHNIKGNVSVTSANASGTVAEGGGSKRPIGFPVPFTDRERSIIRRHAVSAAIELTDGQHDWDETRELALKIERFTSGDELREALEKVEGSVGVEHG